MNEYEWQKARDPEAMLAAAQERLSPRKWVLLNCAVARRIGTAEGDIDKYELDRNAAPGNVLEPTCEAKDRPSGSPAGASPVSEGSPGGFERAFYGPAVARFAQRGVGYSEEARRTRFSFLSLFPRFSDSRAWSLCRPALSSALYADAQVRICLDAAYSVRDLIPSHSLLADTPATRAQATANVRSVQRQLVRDMNAAMRAYAKPANELLAHFLHEQLGNPFRPYEFDPAWRTADVLGLARGIEADRGFDRMPMLADALMEAGCESEPMLRHLREEREQQRGCWVLDLILGHDPEIYAAEPLLGIEGDGGRTEPLGLAVPPDYDV